MADEKRSRGRIFLEDVIGIRVKGKPDNLNLPNTAGTPNDLVNIVRDIDKNNALVGNLADLQEFRELSSDAETRYRIYDEMETDSVISSALDMYADDATQYDVEGRVIWAEAEDSDVQAFANYLIDIFQLNKTAWDDIRSLVKYGDLFLETFRDDETGDDTEPYETQEVNGASNLKMYVPKIGSELEKYIQRVENPAVIYELQRKGKTVGFVKTKENDTNSLEPHYSYQVIQVSNEDVLLPSDKYIHITLPNSERFSQKMDIDITNDETGDTKVVQYKINRGKSILHDLYKSYKELRLMEDALLLNRVTRSSIIRILQIEMGDMPKSQAREVLKRFKTIIEQKNYMDKNDGTYSSQANPGPIDNCIYVPTYNGKGAISMSNLGGDVDIKSIVDLDYFREKLAGGLKIPLSYISGTAQENGLGGGTSLTKIDARYARTVKRIQNAYIQGITNLINLFAINSRLENVVNNFTVKMVSPSTSEDAERVESMMSNIDITNSILDIIANLDELSYDAKKEIVEYLVSTYLGEPEISDIIKDDKGEQEEEDMGEGDDFFGGGGSGHAPRGMSDLDIGGDMGEEPNDEFTGEPDLDLNAETLETNETTGGEGFGDFEEFYGEEV